MDRKDDYYDIYGYDEDDSRNYEELSECEDPEEAIEKIRGTIGKGTCLYCGAKDGMKYEGNVCFICSECGKSVHEDIYYRWAVGCQIEFED